MFGPLRTPTHHPPMLKSMSYLLNKLTVQVNSGDHFVTCLRFHQNVCYLQVEDETCAVDAENQTLIETAEFGQKALVYGPDVPPDWWKIKVGGLYGIFRNDFPRIIFR